MVKNNLEFFSITIDLINVWPWFAINQASHYPGWLSTLFLEPQFAAEEWVAGQEGGLRNDALAQQGSRQQGGSSQGLGNQGLTSDVSAWDNRLGPSDDGLGGGGQDGGLGQGGGQTQTVQTGQTQRSRLEEAWRGPAADQGLTSEDLGAAGEEGSGTADVGGGGQGLGQEWRRQEGGRGLTDDGLRAPQRGGREKGSRLGVGQRSGQSLGRQERGAPRGSSGDLDRSVRLELADWVAGNATSVGQSRTGEDRLWKKYCYSREKLAW